MGLLFDVSEDQLFSVSCPFTKAINVILNSLLPVEGKRLIEAVLSAKKPNFVI